jgi:FkbM family methyltransferase
VAAGFTADFLGTRYRSDFFTRWPPQPHDRYEEPPYPPLDEEYFEWIDLLEAVASAHGHFTMLELGAGFGRWTVRGAAAAQQRGLSYTLVAVEAEPTHFEWLMQNLRDNAVSLQDCRLIRAAATDRDGTIGFHVGDPSACYGQSIGGTTEVAAVSLKTLLRPLDIVDLIDMDVQGAEFNVLAAARESLCQKVKRVHVGVHSQQHRRILELFRDLTWKPHFVYADDTADLTPWGRINFQDGVQGWVNPRLHSGAELRRIHVMRNSAAWRGLQVCRRTIDRVAPPGTLRRRILKRTLSGVGSKHRRDPDQVA